uniref:Uncharacterized protein n=1 Tax=Rhizophagus irregularis (strain DAOM 181602 / DAOM 197198 / MUCL 43194) TaxID=747089 RepID=U9TDY0_RHIID
MMKSNGFVFDYIFIIIIKNIYMLTGPGTLHETLTDAHRLEYADKKPVPRLTFLIQMTTAEGNTFNFTIVTD